MATKPLRTPGKKKQPAAVETSSSLDDKIQAFLKAGGEIEKIKSGVSGQQSMASPKAKAAEAKPAESKPAESTAAESTAAESTAAESTAAESTAAESTDSK